MTSEQIAQLVTDMQARLDMCSQAGQAYRLKWHEVKVIIEAMQALQSQLAQVEKERDDLRKDNEKLSGAIESLPLEQINETTR